MTNMKPPQEGRNTGAPSLRGLQGRSATGLNGQAAKEEVSALWRGGWMPENISGVPARRSVFHLTSPLIGLLAQLALRCFNSGLPVIRAGPGSSQTVRGSAGTLLQPFHHVQDPQNPHSAVSVGLATLGVG